MFWCPLSTSTDLDSRHWVESLCFSEFWKDLSSLNHFVAWLNYGCICSFGSRFLITDTSYAGRRAHCLHWYDLQWRSSWILRCALLVWEAKKYWTANGTLSIGRGDPHRRLSLFGSGLAIPSSPWGNSSNTSIGFWTLASHFEPLCTLTCTTMGQFV